MVSICFAVVREQFSSFSYFFGDFSGSFAVIRGAVLGIPVVSATFLWIFLAVSL